MTDLNEVKLIGRIVKDSVLEQTVEHKYAKFAIAVNKDVKTSNGDYASQPTFIDLAIFDNYAEKMYKFLRKGTLILVYGSLKTRQWSKDDMKINTLGISVNKIQLLSSSKNAGKENTAEEKAVETQNAQETFNSDIPDGFENVDPFDDKTDGIF